MTSGQNLKSVGNRRIKSKINTKMLIKESSGAILTNKRLKFLDLFQKLKNHKYTPKGKINQIFSKSMELNRSPLKQFSQICFLPDTINHFSKRYFNSKILRKLYTKV